MCRLITLIVLAACAIALADSRIYPNPSNQPDAPRTASAIDAKRKYDFAAKQAHDVMFQSLIAADQTYIKTIAELENKTLAEGLSGKAEADRLDAARLAAVDAMKQHEVGTAAGQAIKVTQAKWGVIGTDQWMDAIDRIKTSPSGEITLDSTDLQNFAHGKVKAMDVELSNGLKLMIHETIAPGMSVVTIKQ
jgi:hypothetical protein